MDILLAELGMFKENVFAQIALTILVLAILQVFVRSFIENLIRRAIRSHKYPTEREAKQRGDTLAALFHTTSAIAIWITGIMLILYLLEVNIAALLTGAGFLGFLIGFGAQSTIKDFLAGVFIILENQYRVGDTVTINNVTGVVDNITIRITKLRDLNGAAYFIQNGLITSVSNQTYGYANINLDIDVSYQTDIKKLERVVNETGKKLATDTDWKDKIIEPIKFLRIDSLKDSSITVKVLGKVQPAEQWAVTGEFWRRLKDAFDKNGISLQK